MYQYSLHQKVNSHLQKNGIDIAGEDNLFYARFIAGASAIYALYNKIYASHPKNQAVFEDVLETIIQAYKNRSAVLKQLDEDKQRKGQWFLSNDIAGMSLYVDRFCGDIAALNDKLGYCKKLGVNLLHLMPVFESPGGESDGGYAVSNYRRVDRRFGSLDDLLALQKQMQSEGMYLMLDIVLNHTSHRHEWAVKARQGDTQYQDFYYMYDDRIVPDTFEVSMPEIFPENAPGNFTWVPECGKWVMTVFHNYQWDLNYTNPEVFAAMLDTIFFYANMGVDILRIDAPAFIWKEIGTTCQNLPMAHTILQLIWQCVQVAAPGVAILGEAIVAPKDIMVYFGTGQATAQECDVAYNATQMALQWDMLATGDTRVMLAAQPVLQQKPYGTTWITYTRCHDDIGLGFSDEMIEQAGYMPYSHRSFLKEYYSGQHGSPAKGALFSVNPKTQDARMSGSLASLCGLEKALEQNNQYNIILSIKKILLMQAHTFFLGGIPMLFYGDEAGYTNDYSYLSDPGKAYDNRWMHRPLINWKKNEKSFISGTIEHSIFSGTQQLLALRRKFVEVSDFKNITWLTPHNIHVAGFIRHYQGRRLFFVFNFDSQPAFLTWYAFKEHGNPPYALYDHWNNANHIVGKDYQYLIIDSYSFCVLEPVEALG
jgi:amylosucrase